MTLIRQHLAFRLFGAFVLMVTVLWIGYLVAVYRRASWQSDLVPPPQRLATVATLIEATPPSGRTLLIGGLTSDTFRVHVEPGDVVDNQFDDLPRQSRYEVADYDQALGGRRFSIANEIDERPRVGFIMRRFVPAKLEFRVRLATGETMIVESRSPFLTTEAGLPVGLFAGLLGSAVGLFTLVLVFIASRPLRELADAVATLDLDGAPRVLPNAAAFSPEIRRLTEAYNTLHGRVAALLRNRMELVGGISHDVRTFATRLRLKVDAIEDEASRESAVRDIEDMVRLLDDAVMTSRAGAGELQEELVGLRDLVTADCAMLAEAGRPALFEDASAGDPLTVLGDRVALRRILANLIDNAIKYGDVAHVSLRREAQEAVLVIEDRGPGVPPGEREALFEPFHRLETSRSRATGGAGLGLAVVKTLAEGHGGSVNVGEASTGGLSVQVRLPLFSPRA
ncbi:MAG TPA: ATP-binding protein [Ensifer sp.]|nr:ATP-binding protein [Ensifer sp.]